MNYDPQTHRFGNILPRERTYHVEHDTVRMLPPTAPLGRM